MRPFTLLYFTSLAFVYSYSEEEYHHSLKKRSASPQIVLTGQQIDPLTAAVGVGAAGAGALLVNHLLGDPAGKAVRNHFGKKNNRRPVNRPPTNVEHHHHHYIPEYETEEAAYWYDWSPWQNSVCSRSCGTGTMNQRRRRDCSQGPNACSGHAEEAKQASCNSQECPVDGFWLAYSEWQDNGVCSRSCGGGTRLLVRHRQCQGPYGGGRACAGSSEDTKSIQCSPQACPKDGIWGAWNVRNGQSCRAACGAGTVVQARERTCIGPYNGGRPCVGESYTERCVEDKSYRTEGHYTASPGVPTVHSNPRPSYGVGNGAINPRQQGARALDDEIAHGEPEKPVYGTSRIPRDPHSKKIKSSSNASSSLTLYDGILTPTGNGNSRQAINKPVYGAANSY